MKTARSDTSAEEDKFQLLNLNLGLGYNFAADSLRLSELGMDFRTAIGEVLTIGGNARFNFYRFQEDANNPLIGRRVDKLLISSGGGLADLTAFSITVGTRLKGEPGKDPVDRLPRDTTQTKSASQFVGLYQEVEPDFKIPWNLDLTWTFAQNQADPRRVIRSSTIGARLGFNLTENWKITASVNYDILQRQVAAPQITVYRDLHCWELDFSWVPTGQYRNYRVAIRLKTPMLRDLKVTKQSQCLGCLLGRLLVLFAPVDGALALEDDIAGDGAGRNVRLLGKGIHHVKHHLFKDGAKRARTGSLSPWPSEQRPGGPRSRNSTRRPPYGRASCTA